MESPGLTSSPDDALDAELQRLHVVTLPDNGFSIRVLAALPPSRQSASRRRILLCTIGVFAAVAVAFAQGQPTDWNSLNRLISWPNLPDFTSLESLRFDSPLVVASVATLATLAFVKLLDVLPRSEH